MFAEYHILTGPPSRAKTTDDTPDPAEHKEEHLTELAAPRVQHEDTGDGRRDLDQLHQDEVDVHAAAQAGGIEAKAVVDHDRDEPVDEEEGGRF